METVFKCTKCEVEKPLSAEFFNKTNNTQTGFEYHCKNCRNEYQKKYRELNRKNLNKKAAEEREKNRGKAREYAKKYYRANKEKANADSRRYYQAHKEKAKEESRRYYHENKERLRELVKEEEDDKNKKMDLQA